jgi:hypothetical protein
VREFFQREESRELWRKRHIAEQTFAVHRAFSPKRHVFRREFGQFHRQLAPSQAKIVEESILAILFL